MGITHELDFMAVSSYGPGRQSTGVVKIDKDLRCNITHRDVIIVEDIIDSGLTVAHLADLLGTRNPRSIRVAALLDKLPARKKDVVLHYLDEDLVVVCKPAGMLADLRALGFRAIAIVDPGVKAVNFTASGGGPKESKQQTNQRRLACAVGAE